jgi:hypothetical protein
VIASRKTAEGFLGKSLKSLGDIDPKMKGRVSYYVLSADGGKNLGGPYTKSEAKVRLRQVEYFKRNPNPSASAVEAKRNATEDYDAGLITRRQMQSVHRRANATLQERAASRVKVRDPEPNPKPFHQREHDWNEVLIQRPGKKLTRKQILDYYKKNARNIWPYLEGQTVIVILAPSKNNFILRRKRAKGDKHIKLTKLKGIDDEQSFEYWIYRRAIEFHPVLTGKMTPILWLDLDMHTTKGKAARAKLFDKMKKAAPRIRRVFRKFGINKIYVYESGQDGGLHFEGDLKKRQNVDKLRKDFTEALAKTFEDDPGFTTGLTKSGQIRLDTSTFHTLGSLRAPYSMTVTGHAKRRISV